MDQLTPKNISIHKQHYLELITIAEKLAPLEACGIIGGKFGLSTKVFHVTNTLNSPYEYLMDPSEMLKAFWEIDEQEWEVLAFFHSHPVSRPIPSKIDLARNYYPETPHLILGKSQSGWEGRAYLLGKTEFKEIPIEIAPDEDL
jgi:proteasome lid subunit RPN8/RPN11